MPLFTPSLLKSLDLLKFVSLGCRRRMRGDILDWDKTNWIFDTGKISEMEVRHFYLISKLTQELKVLNLIF